MLPISHSPQSTMSKAPSALSSACLRYPEKTPRTLGQKCVAMVLALVIFATPSFPITTSSAHGVLPLERAPSIVERPMTPPTPRVSPPDPPRAVIFGKPGNPSSATVLPTARGSSKIKRFNPFAGKQARSLNSAALKGRSVLKNPYASPDDVQNAIENIRQQELLLNSKDPNLLTPLEQRFKAEMALTRQGLQEKQELGALSGVAFHGKQGERLFKKRQRIPDKTHIQNSAFDAGSNSFRVVGGLNPLARAVPVILQNTKKIITRAFYSPNKQVFEASEVFAQTRLNYTDKITKINLKYKTHNFALDPSPDADMVHNLQLFQSTIEKSPTPEIRQQMTQDYEELLYTKRRLDMAKIEMHDRVLEGVQGDFDVMMQSIQHDQEKKFISHSLAQEGSVDLYRKILREFYKPQMDNFEAQLNSSLVETQNLLLQLNKVKPAPDESLYLHLKSREEAHRKTLEKIKEVKNMIEKETAAPEINTNKNVQAMVEDAKVILKDSKKPLWDMLTAVILAVVGLLAIPAGAMVYVENITQTGLDAAGSRI